MENLGNRKTLLRYESEWLVIPNCHEPIITDEEYARAQSAIKKDKKHSEHKPLNYLLRSILRCGVCGRSLQRGRMKNNYFFCKKSVANDNTNCPVEERFNEKTLEAVIVRDFLEKMNLLVDADRRIREAAAKTQGSEENLQFRLSQAEKKKKQITLSRVSIYEQYADGKITKETYLFERDRLNRELEDLTAEQQSAEQELSALKQSRYDELGQAAEKAKEFIEADEVTNEMLLFFIDRVYVYSGMRMEIRYRFSDRIKEVLTAEPSAKGQDNERG